MSKKITIVGISNSVVHAAIDQELLSSALAGIKHLELEAGIQIDAPASQAQGEEHAGGYSAYIASGTFQGSEESLRTQLRALPITETAGLDFSVVPAHLTDPEQKKLVIMDVDSTLVSQEVIDQLAARTGKADRVAALTDAAMKGEVDFEKSLRDRVAVLEGQPQAILSDVAHELTFTAGAQELIRLLHEEGHVVAAVSGGFIEILKPLAEKIGLDYARANKLAIKNGYLTGEFEGEIITAEKKRAALKEWAKDAGISKKNIIAIGDGANDELMLNEAALGIAFNAKPGTREKADAQLNIYRLDAVRHFIGL